MSEPSTQNSES